VFGPVPRPFYTVRLPPTSVKAPSSDANGKLATPTISVQQQSGTPNAESCSVDAKPNDLSSASSQVMSEKEPNPLAGRLKKVPPL
jgi:hypothetical protein